MDSEREFTWVEFYGKFADKLLQYVDKRTELINKIKKAFAEIPMKLPKLETNGDPVDIDPFTVFGLFNKGLTDEHRIAIITSLAKEFNVDAQKPTSFFGIPVLNLQHGSFYWFLPDRGENDIDNLWDMFRVAISFAGGKNVEKEKEFIGCFNRVMKQTGVKWNLTMGLYWIRPEYYVNLDSRNRWFMSLPGDMLNSIYVKHDGFKTVPTGEQYVQLCAECRTAFSNGKYHSIKEYSYAAWQEADKVNALKKAENKSKKKEDWFPTDYNPNISVDEWIQLLKNPEVFTSSSLEIMKRIMDFGGEATCTQLSQKYGETKNFYNAGSSALARRVANKTGCKVMPREDDDSRWWPILYVGKKAGKEEAGSYIWKLRDELKEAIKKIDFSAVNVYATQEEIEKAAVYTEENFLKDVYMDQKDYESLIALIKNKKNIILEGPPGVGKTFAAKRLAYSIMKVKDDSRIEMVQFHQSYSYEDFVIGYRPVGTEFKLIPGIFYNFCKKAETQKDIEFFFIIDEINRGNMSKIFGELLMLIEKDYRGTSIKLAYGYETFTVPKNLYIIGMMNTADRSLAIIDYALRRRFSFFTMQPGFSSKGFRAYQAGLNSKKIDKVLYQIERLNDEIKNDDALGEGFEIGHSYFCGQETYNDGWLHSVINYDIIPMLKEYWFDSKERVREWKKNLEGALND